MAMQALMLLISCGLPWLVSVPSLRRMIWGCCSAEEGRVSHQRSRSGLMRR
jgi:hypothetical protein